MDEATYEQMKRYVGFDRRDADILRRLGENLQPEIGAIVDLFYERLLADPGAANVLNSSKAGINKFKGTLRDWLEGVFMGPYDREYLERISRTGRTHVRVRLPQQYMFVAMNVLRTELIRRVHALDRPDTEQCLVSLNKALDLELAVMLDSYREDYSRRIREAERKKMEQRLEESAHLANVGELAATLAHEIKNPLAGISGAIQVLGTALETEDPRKEIIGEILVQIERLDRIARDLLVYARPKPPELIPQKIGRIIRRTLRFVRQLPVMQGLTLRCKGLDCDAVAPVDESQIEQVISNLVVNAAHACEDGGGVTITLSDDWQNVRIVIADTGQGMSRESLQRAFEPFFTTRSQGTGLGLPICKRIVESHNGRISIKSIEGEGSKVLITIPK